MQLRMCLLSRDGKKDVPLIHELLAGPGMLSSGDLMMNRRRTNKETKRTPAAKAAWGTLTLIFSMIGIMFVCPNVSAWILNRCEVVKRVEGGI